MHPRESRDRRLKALHNAELAGREAAKSGGGEHDHPYVGKKLRGAVVGLYRAWRRGFDEQKQEQVSVAGGPT
jgi:hypothetical protein